MLATTTQTVDPFAEVIEVVDLCLAELVEDSSPLGMDPSPNSLHALETYLRHALTTRFEDAELDVTASPTPEIHVLVRLGDPQEFTLSIPSELTRRLV